MLRPGQYAFTPDVRPAEQEWGLAFVPPTKDFIVTTSPSPSSSLSFTQFTASLSGTLSCLEWCPPSGVPVTMSQGGRRETASATPSSSSGPGVASFSFSSLLPGSVSVSLDYPLWCWEAETITVEINPDLVPSVNFVQTGYAMLYTTSHDVTVLVGKENDTGVEYSLEKGSGRKCLAAPGLYTVTPKSCHRFQMQYGFDTSFPAPLVLTAVAHTVTATVLSPSPSADITLLVRSLGLGEKERVVSASSEVIELLQEDSTKYLFTFHILAKPHDELDVVPQSSSLLFIPSHREFLVSQVCPEKVPLFEGSQGVTLSGHVGPPPLGGVAITVTLGDDGEEIHTATDSQGLYRVGPIHGGKSYTVSAALSGYTFQPLPGDPLSFTSLRLGHINIQVLEEESGSPLSPVLLSLSGSHGFRSNNFTKPDGTLEYRDLVPGEYFLKPLLREFEFTPSSTSLTLGQGSVEDVTYTGQRVAFGCAGRVTSLNGHPLEGAVVMLAGSGGSECTVTEEATTGDDGQYLFRGLPPTCDYVVSVRDGGPNDIAHTLPSSRHIKLESKDLVDVYFAAVFAIRDIYISGNVLTDPKHFSTLQVQVYSESRMESPLTTAGVNSIGFFDLTPLPNRSEDYYIILDTNLPSHFYQFTRPRGESAWQSRLPHYPHLQCSGHQVQ
ncbi:Nodal modulator 1 [Geodia barretti]|nr:Nodal modulator 1 [Geodia barretti]